MAAIREQRGPRRLLSKKADGTFEPMPDNEFYEFDCTCTRRWRPTACSRRSAHDHELPRGHAGALARRKQVLPKRGLCGRGRKRCGGLGPSQRCLPPGVATVPRRRPPHRSALASGAAPRHKARQSHLRCPPMRFSLRYVGYNFNSCSGTQTFSNLNVPTAPDVTCIPGPCPGATASYRAFAYSGGSRGTGPRDQLQRAVSSGRPSTGAGFVPRLSWLRHGCRGGMDSDAALISYASR